jgi:hypothetical protein
MNDIISVEGVILPNQPLINIQIIGAVEKIEDTSFQRRVLQK